MKTMKYISYSLLSLALVACASTPTQNNPEKYPKVMNTKQVKAEEIGIKGYESIPASQVKAKGNCSVANDKWKALEMRDTVKLATSCAAEKNWIAVEKIGEEFAQKNPNSPWGPYFLSLSAEARQDFPRAEWMIELALKKSPSLGILHYQKGRLLFMDSAQDEAVTEISKSLELDQNNFAAHLFLGQIYYRDQEFGKAAVYFEAAHHLDSHNITALIGLAECRMQQKDVAAAIELFNQAVQNAPKSLAFRVRYATVLETQEKDIEKALQAYRDIKKLHGEKKLEGILSINVDEKINFLEKRLRSIASVNTLTDKKESVKKVIK